MCRPRGRLASLCLPTPLWGKTGLKCRISVSLNRVCRTGNSEGGEPEDGSQTPLGPRRAVHQPRGSSLSRPEEAACLVFTGKCKNFIPRESHNQRVSLSLLVGRHSRGNCPQLREEKKKQHKGPSMEAWINKMWQRQGNVTRP